MYKLFAGKNLKINFTSLTFLLTSLCSQKIQSVFSVFWTYNFGKAAVLLVVPMMVVISVLPSSRVTLEHIEAPQSCNQIATAATTAAEAVAAVPWMVYDS